MLALQGGSKGLAMQGMQRWAAVITHTPMLQQPWCSTMQTHIPDTQVQNSHCAPGISISFDQNAMTVCAYHNTPTAANTAVHMCLQAQPT